LVDDAWAAAADLDGASDAVAGRRKNAGRDSAVVNRAEGRVLVEMRIAMHAFAYAADESGLVKRLVPGPGTAAVLSPARAKGKSAGNGAGATPAASPA
jgi:hypothetical protein